jgi:hypothetical protein
MFFKRCFSNWPNPEIIYFIMKKYLFFFFRQKWEAWTRRKKEPGCRHSDDQQTLQNPRQNFRFYSPGFLLFNFEYKKEDCKLQFNPSSYENLFSYIVFFRGSIEKMIPDLTDPSVHYFIPRLCRQGPFCRILEKFQIRESTKSDFTKTF